MFIGISIGANRQTVITPVPTPTSAFDAAYLFTEFR